jgi:hypothetical protein
VALRRPSLSIRSHLIVGPNGQRLTGAGTNLRQMHRAGSRPVEPLVRRAALQRTTGFGEPYGKTCRERAVRGHLCPLPLTLPVTPREKEAVSCGPGEERGFLPASVDDVPRERGLEEGALIFRLPVAV